MKLISDQPNSASNNRSNNLAEILLLWVFIYIVFKPTELITSNIYHHLYYAGWLAGIVLVRRMATEKVPRALWGIVGISFTLTTIALLETLHNGFLDRISIFTWPAWFFVMCLGVFLSTKAINYELRISQIFKTIIVIQLCITVIQLLEPDAFDLVWSSAKTKGLGEVVRVTGSMHNPNYFAFIITFLAAGIIAYKGPKIEYRWVLLSYSLIILSGSRTMILGFPLIIASWYYLEHEASVFKKAKGIILSSLGLYLFAFFILFLFPEQLKYSAQLLSSFAGNNGLDGINSYRTREDIWYASITEILNRNTLQILFGVNSGPEYKPHQGFIYISAQFGILGLTLYCGLLLLLLSLAYKLRVSLEGKLLYMTCLAVIGSSLTSTYSANMTLGIILAFVTGLAIQRHWYLLNQVTIEKAIT